MGTVSTTLPSDGQTIDAADVNTPINAILSEFNGNIDNDNIKSTAAIAGSKLADASITNAKLSTTAGELGGAWQDWTPTWTNLSGGTLNYAKYTQIGKTVFFRLKYTLGGAGVAGDVSLTPPVAINTEYDATTGLFGQARFADTGTATYDGTIGVLSTKLVLRVNNASSTYTSLGVALSSTIPFTWANTDAIILNGSYEAAA